MGDFSPVPADATVWGGKKDGRARKLCSWSKTRGQGNKIERALNAFSGYADSLSSLP